MEQGEAIDTVDEFLEEVDVNPCHVELNEIFDESLIEEAPADSLLHFMNHYCVDASDIFMPSKLLNSRTF